MWPLIGLKLENIMAFILKESFLPIYSFLFCLVPERFSFRVWQSSEMKKKFSASFHLKLDFFQSLFVCSLIVRTMSTNLCSVAAAASSFSVHLYAESADFHWPELCDARRMPLLRGLWLVVSSQQRKTRPTDWSELKRREKVVQVHLETQQEENQVIQSCHFIS